MSGPGLRPLTAADMPALRALIEHHPIEYGIAAGALDGADWDPDALGADLLGVFWSHELVGALFIGANLIPIELDAAAVEVVAAHLRTRQVRSGVLTGNQAEVCSLWRRLEPQWGPAVVVRDDLRVLGISDPALVSRDPQVRVASPADLGAVVDAAVASRVEDFGRAQSNPDAVESVRRIMQAAISEGRVLLGVDPSGKTTFFAELVPTVARTMRVRGVWIPPALRGRGGAAPAIACAVQQARDLGARSVGVVVDGGNTPARRAYARVGFVEVGQMATIVLPAP